MKEYISVLLSYSLVMPKWASKDDPSHRPRKIDKMKWEPSWLQLQIA